VQVKLEAISAATRLPIVLGGAPEDTTALILSVGGLASSALQDEAGNLDMLNLREGGAVLGAADDLIP
jgi:hypothetical protein